MNSDIEKKVKELEIRIQYLEKTIRDYIFFNRKIANELERFRKSYKSEIAQIYQALNRKGKNV